ncbi:MAG TPA: hypothetical protein VL242_03900, partial [Sorangium sp.]|nr:hypothetical protein [Sorangium sp.]
MQAQAPCLLIPSSPESGVETGVPEPAERRGDATAPPAERRGDATASPAERRGDATASPAAGAAAG